MPPRLSIIIPLFNKAPYLERTLDSVRRQTMLDWECIVVDDGSTDGGGEIAARFPDRRIRLVVQENRGVGHARNRGVAESRADILAFLDADDMWDADYLESQLDPLMREPTLAASVCAHRRVCGDNAADFCWPGAPAGAWRLPIDSAPADVRHAVNAMHSGATVIRRSVFERYHGFYEKNRCSYGEDTWLWIQVLFGHPIWWNPQARMTYRMDASLLGPGRPAPYPPWPMLLDSDPIMQACPASYLALLQSTLAYYAIIAASRCWRAGNPKEATHILKRVRHKVAPGNHAVSRLLLGKLVRLRVRRSLHWTKLLAYAAFKASTHGSQKQLETP